MQDDGVQCNIPLASGLHSRDVASPSDEAPGQSISLAELWARAAPTLAALSTAPHPSLFFLPPPFNL